MKERYHIVIGANLYNILTETKKFQPTVGDREDHAKQ